MRFLSRKPVVQHFKINFPLPAEKIQNALKKIQHLNHSNTSALCLSFSGLADSPQTTHLLYHGLLTIQQYNRLPLYSFLEDKATSLTYLASSPANYIYANPYSLIGDVGITHKSYRSIRKLLQWVGIKYEQIGGPPRIWNQFGQITEREKQITAKWLSSVQSGMVEEIARRRNIPRQSIKSIQNKLFSPRQALNAKLVDHISTFEEFSVLNYPNHQIQEFVYQLQARSANIFQEKEILALNTLLQVSQMPQVALFSMVHPLQESLDTIMQLISERLSNNDRLDELEYFLEDWMHKVLPIRQGLQIH